ncbi:hypothetical protein [uncultured Odoribacter sp.]|uniref:hypothetical protein n=1 Tax=uncultured Odoribacter sp. TaxID=876416 RepID=UPI002607EB36|nr:hypothetical protein [uncultured Odoribacter sp.]
MFNVVYSGYRDRVCYPERNVVREWLSEFAYRTPVYWWVFLLAGAATVLITILTVSYQSWKAASVNLIGTLGGE